MDDSIIPVDVSKLTLILTLGSHNGQFTLYIALYQAKNILFVEITCFKNNANARPLPYYEVEFFLKYCALFQKKGCNLAKVIIESP